MSTIEVNVPDIGDFDAVEVIEICVVEGDTVGVDDALVVIESDKASMEIPAGAAGTVNAIRVSIGDQVKEGDVIALISAATAETATDSPDEPAADGVAAGSNDADEVGTAAVAAKDDQPTQRCEANSSAPASAGEVEIRVPDIGDAADVEVIEVAVAAGDEVGANDLLVVVESDKASMEIPAGQAGTVSAVHVTVGDPVAEDSLLVTLKLAAGVTAPRPAAVDDMDESPSIEESAQSDTGEAAPVHGPEAASTGSVQMEHQPNGKVYAGPAVRRLARELGVDLTRVNASGSRGRIVKDDVKSFVKSAMTQPAQTVTGGIPAIPEIDHAKFGPVEVAPLSRIRAAGAANLHRSWLNVPHVTQLEEADVTELEEFRRSLKAEAVRREVKVTPLSFIVKACCHALKAFPSFNASLDTTVKSLTLKHYYHIGFAVDTDEGLVVPVIRDADQLGIWELSQAITELAEKARTQSLDMNDMRGGSFSISSLGGIGGTGFTPIINAPEVAILGVSRLATKPIWDGAAFVPRQILPLSLSYDHRAINGAEAGRFLAALTELLADIRRLAL